jgi:hypothetical protein
VISSRAFVSRRPGRCQAASTMFIVPEAPHDVEGEVASTTAEQVTEKIKNSGSGLARIRTLTADFRVDSQKAYRLYASLCVGW